MRNLHARLIRCNGQAYPLQRTSSSAATDRPVRWSWMGAGAHLEDRVDVLLVLLHGVGVIEAHVGDAAVLARHAEVEADALGVPDVQVPVRLGGEARHHLKPPRPPVGTAGARGTGVATSPTREEEKGVGGGTELCSLLARSFSIMLEMKCRRGPSSAPASFGFAAVFSSCACMLSGRSVARRAAAARRGTRAAARTAMGPDERRAAVNDGAKAMSREAPSAVAEERLSAGRSDRDLRAAAAVSPCNRAPHGPCGLLRRMNTIAIATAMAALVLCSIGSSWPMGARTMKKPVDSAHAQQGSRRGKDGMKTPLSPPG